MAQVGVEAELDAKTIHQRIESELERAPKVSSPTGAADQIVRTADADASGAWSVTLPVVKGENHFTVVAKDPETARDSEPINVIAEDPSNPDILYVGTGEETGGGYSYDGEGVLRTLDGGNSWTNLGLAEVRRIGKLAIDPLDPDRIFVAAVGGDGRFNNLVDALHPDSIHLDEEI